MQNSPLIEWCQKDIFESRAKELIRPVSVVLDIGCGIRPQRFIVPDVAICVEPHQEYIKFLKRSADSANLIIIPLAAIEALKALPDKSIDSIFMIDVIEHMPKSAGREVVEECQRVAREQVIVFTPLGFMPQSVHADEKDGWGMSGGEYQDHKSGWYPEDFTGWQIIGCKDFHSVDHRGRKVVPPYGGFYAIRDLPRRSDLFNREYADEVIAHLKLHFAGTGLFEEYLRDFVDREHSRISTRCALKTCLIAAEQLSGGLDVSQIEAFFKDLDSRRHEIFSEERAEFNRRVAALGDTFPNYGERERLLRLREDDLARREAALESRESELARRVSAFNSSRSVRLMRTIGLLR